MEENLIPKFRDNIKSWAEEDRPREKLLLKGKSVLTDAELIAILIRSGNNEKTAVDVAREILAKVNNNLNDLAKLTVQDLMEFKGIGEAKALSIIAALELGGRRQAAPVTERPQIKTSADIFQIFQHLADIPNEEFWVVFLNRHNKVIAKEQLSIGGITGTIVDSKILFKKAMMYLCNGIILCHNHPSGNIQPSETDIQLTKRLKEAGKLMEIPILDHIIIGEKNYYSFADNGMI